ncbi:MAG: SHD1 domain-containing protein [Planctomycetales bacterium]
MKARSILFLAVILLVGTTTAFAKLRTWTDAQGRTVKADFVRMNGAVVVLKSNTGKVISIPFAQLSEDDQDYLRDLLESKGKGDQIPPAAPPVDATGPVNGGAGGAGGAPPGGIPGAGMPPGSMPPGAGRPGAPGVPGQMPPGSFPPGGAAPGGIPGGAPTGIPTGGIPGAAPGAGMPPGSAPGGMPGATPGGSMPGAGMPGGGVPGGGAPGGGMRPGGMQPGSGPPGGNSNPSANAPMGGSAPRGAPPGGGMPGAGMAGAGVPQMQFVETKVCRKCNKEVSSSSKAGDKCPHCGVVWDFEEGQNGSKTWAPGRRVYRIGGAIAGVMTLLGAAAAGAKKLFAAKD